MFLYLDSVTFLVYFGFHALLLFRSLHFQVSIVPINEDGKCTEFGPESTQIAKIHMHPHFTWENKWPNVAILTLTERKWYNQKVGRLMLKSTLMMPYSDECFTQAQSFSYFGVQRLRALNDTNCVALQTITLPQSTMACFKHPESSTIEDYVSIKLF